jgi:hypothetical protein
MKGSWSFKKVMPTIDPALDYDNLEGVQEGLGAQARIPRDRGSGDVGGSAGGAEGAAAEVLRKGYVWMISCSGGSWQVSVHREWRQ